MSQVEVFKIKVVDGKLTGDAGLFKQSLEKASGNVLYQIQHGDDIWIYVRVLPGTKIERPR